MRTFAFNKWKNIKLSRLLKQEKKMADLEIINHFPQNPGKILHI